MRTFENHTQWSAVKEVCRRLKEAGYEALLAGGCVRDLILGRLPNDFDIATNATPDQVESLFPKSIGVGKAFGVMIIPYPEGFQLEVATFREDLEYKDGRRPEGVRFSNPQADAKRRDFTINALFYDVESKQILDFVGGQSDIQKKLIRTVGKPEQRFEEDKLRLMRAVRFSAQLDFDIEAETLASITQMASEIQVVSRERVRDELMKLLKSSHRQKGLKLLLTTGLMSALFPELSSQVLADETQWLDRLAAAGDKIDMRVLLSLFFFPAFQASFKDQFRENHLKALRLDHQLINAILFNLGELSHFLKPESVRRGEMALKLASPYAESAEQLAQVIEALSDGRLADGPPAEEERKKRAQYIFDLKRSSLKENGEKPEAFLSGEDLKKLGVSPGPAMGKLLNEAYLLQLEGKFSNRAEAISWLKSQLPH